jgi:hypothetical protein
MGALNEVVEILQTHDECQWFRSDDLDLIAWCDESGMPRVSSFFTIAPLVAS